MRAIGCFAAWGFLLAAWPAAADVFFFSTGNPDGKIATLSRPAEPGLLETETADDFVVTQTTAITSATFTGLVTNVGSVGAVSVAIYQVFPEDSDPTRTLNVVTRMNSPSDNEILDRSSGSDLTFSTTTLNTNFTAANSVVNGIHAAPNQFTGGEGPVTGVEDEFSVDFTSPLVLAAGHYFFVPEVQVTGGGNFLWLSAPMPIVAPGTPFTPDRQAWIRNDGPGTISPDWSRIGTDITHQGPFNMTFSLTGVAVPEPATWAMMLVGL